jgi:PAS domain S-box-containing protein
MKHYAHRTVPQGRELPTLIVAIGFVMFIGVMTYASWVGYRRSSEEQDITRRIVRATNRLLSSVKDAETGQRGFLVTGQENYLEPYYAALLRIPQELTELTTLTASRPDEVPLVEAVKPLVQDKLAELLQTIELHRTKGLSAALPVVMSGRGKAAMEQIRGICAELETSAYGRFGVQSAEMLKRGNEMGLIGTIGAIALLALLIMATVSMQRGTHRRKQLILELEKSEEETRQARDWFQTTLASIGDAVIATDADARITFLNEVAESLTGWAQQEAVGKPLDQVFLISNETTGATVDSPVAKALREGRIVGLANHTKLTAKSGSETPIDDSAAPIRDGDGNITGVVLVFRDIRERKEAEDELKRAEQRFRTAVAAVSGLLWTNNAKGEMEGDQPSWGRFTGQTPEEYRGYGWSKAVHPDDAQPSVDEWNRAVAERRKFVFEHRVRRHDGAWRLFSICALPVIDEAGVIQEWVGVHTDITDRKQVQQDLEASEARLRFMAESMPQKIFTANAMGEVIYFNEQWMDFTGLTFTQIRDWGWVQFIHPDDVQENIRLWKHSIDTGELFQLTTRVRRHDGAYRWHLSRAHPMRDAEGNRMMWLGSTTEIHEQRELQEKLTRANQDLESFAYSASHDLQEPLRMITSYSQMLISSYKGQLDGEAEMCVGFITDGTRRMRELLADLLAYTAVDAKTTDDTEFIDLNVIVEEVTRSMQVAIQESGAVITSDPLPVISGHRAHFVQLFQNLLSNGIKYRSTRPCRIRISVEGQNGSRRFAFTDNGIGIAPEHHERIFGVFKRLHGKKIPGTGIGLAICQRVVERYRGRLWVESEPGTGSTFVFTLPVGGDVRKVSA